MIEPARAKAAPTPRVLRKLSAARIRSGAAVKPDVKLSEHDIYGCVEWFDYRRHSLEPEKPPLAKDMP
jgi:hypothetical protein